MTFFRFIKSKVFWLSVVAAIVLIIILLCIASWCMRIYTQSGRIIMVPQLEGYTEAQVKPQLRNVGLDCVVIDSMYKHDAAPGVIVDQIPAAGKNVKKGRKIYVTINAFAREMVKMPQLVDYSLRNAQVVIETAGLQLGNVEYMPSEYAGLVLDQRLDGKTIKQGTKLPKGSRVDLVVGSGRSRNSSVIPNVIGLTLYDAEQTLRNSSLNVGSKIYDSSIVTRIDTAVAVVHKQSPEAVRGATAPTGSMVNLWLTRNMELVIDAMAASTDNE